MLLNIFAPILFDRCPTRKWLLLSAWVTTLVLLPVIMLSGQAPAPFLAGEMLHYEIRWGIFHVGVATLELDATSEWEGKPAVHIRQTAKTNGFADAIYRVRNDVQSWMAPDLSHALHYTKTEQEGKRARDVVVRFDWPTLKTTYSNQGTAEPPVDLLPGCQDPLSVVYAARLHPWTVGESFTIPVTNGRRTFESVIKVVRLETIKTKAGKFDAILLEPEIKDLGGVFRKSKDAKIEFWFTNDERRIPLVMASKVSVGKFRAELVSIEHVPVPVTTPVAADGTAAAVK